MTFSNRAGISAAAAVLLAGSAYGAASLVMQASNSGTTALSSTNSAYSISKEAYDTAFSADNNATQFYYKSNAAAPTQLEFDFTNASVDSSSFGAYYLVEVNSSGTMMPIINGSTCSTTTNCAALQGSIAAGKLKFSASSGMYALTNTSPDVNATSSITTTHMLTVIQMLTSSLVAAEGDFNGTIDAEGAFNDGNVSIDLTVTASLTSSDTVSLNAYENGATTATATVTFASFANYLTAAANSSFNNTIGVSTAYNLTKFNDGSVADTAVVTFAADTNNYIGETYPDNRTVVVKLASSETTQAISKVVANSTTLTYDATNGYWPLTLTSVGTASTASFTVTMDGSTTINTRSFTFTTDHTPNTSSFETGYASGTTLGSWTTDGYQGTVPYMNTGSYSSFVKLLNTGSTTATVTVTTTDDSGNQCSGVAMGTLASKNGGVYSADTVVSNAATAGCTVTAPFRAVFSATTAATNIETVTVMKTPNGERVLPVYTNRYNTQAITGDNNSTFYGDGR